MLHVNGLTYRLDPRLILDGATAAIPSGHKVGLMWRTAPPRTPLDPAEELRRIDVDSDNGSKGSPESEPIRLAKVLGRA